MPSPLSVVPAHIPPFSLSELTHTLFRTKNNPEIILLIKEEAIQGIWEFPFQMLLKTVWTSISKKLDTDDLVLQWKNVLTAVWSVGFLSFLPPDNL